MGKADQDWQNEQKRVDRVVDEIERRIDMLQDRAGKVKADIVGIRKHFWEDVTVNLDEPDDAVETAASMKQQAEVLSERERSHRHTQNQLDTLKRLKDSPYFGRIDFTEEGEQETERIYLGIASLLDEKDEQFLIYDWRAPISSLYYDYGPGPVQYETPGGTVTGIMELKRQFIIRNGRIRSMFDTGVTIGDEMLQEVLGKQADTQMKSIVATIQKEQNRIIRNERSRLLVVQGAAGSGKTSAALQRVAYLLYRYRETLRAEQIVLFSPNPIFNSYVSTVLPELGEENMAQTTFQEHVERRISKEFRLEDPFDQMEYVLTAMENLGYDVRIKGIRYKAGLDFMKLMDRYVAYLGREGMKFRDISFRGKVVIRAERIQERFYSLDASLSIPRRMELLAEWLLEELEVLAEQERKKTWVEEEIQLLDQAAYQRVYRKLQREKRFTENTFDDFDREQELLAQMVVQKHFKPLRTYVKNLRFIDAPAVYRQLFEERTIFQLASADSLPKDWPEICEQTVKKLDRSELAYEDATPYLYLKERLEGSQTNTSVRYVFIDEAQDYSPFQFAFIQRLFPHSNMTVLGDLNQTIVAHAGEGFSKLASLFGFDQTETIVLKRSYRSTRPIVEFTRQMIKGGEAIEPFNRDGKKPSVTKAVDQGELVSKITKCIRKLQAAGHRTIAVIGKTARESRKAYEALQKHFSIRLIDKETASFESGIMVIPSYLAKGVEFDAVIIYNASQVQYGRESERKLFYTACTRAMHELHIFFVDRVSPFISGVSPDTYAMGI
ncbi:DNA helicase [Marinithermofilum abyssi]|uniref:DNA helicase n=1 Tax=Marinithermofilum abyssi TaxID=1571185 RepID=A0A8J2VHN6_9BACL|nr:RNA polymerase recycling motor HelD [Marinithermofilum abyssi]GGE15288.1 DNA helicase [Marinithermofilum abyssi]